MSDLRPSLDYVVLSFGLVGLLVVLAWLYDTFKSGFCLVHHSVREWFCAKEYTLTERFGSWAGECQVCGLRFPK